MFVKQFPVRNMFDNTCQKKANLKKNLSLPYNKLESCSEIYCLHNYVPLHVIYYIALPKR